nr:capsid protein [Cressdnaviricota sp.]UOF82862.1 capsid protein [Cressdnaviricota sp.]
MAKYTKRRPTLRRPRRYKKKPAVSKAVVKYVKRHTPKPEFKRELDGFTENIVSATITPYLNFEPLIAQGTALNQRIGCQIRMKGIYLKTMFHNNSTLTQTVRCLVLSTSSDTDTTPATMELFQDISSAGAVTTIQTSGTNFGNMLFRINKRKFHVHYDRVFKLGSTNSTDGKDVIILRKLIKLNSTIKYEANTTGVGNQSKRFIILYLTSDPALDASGGAIEITGNHYYYFIDT